MHTIYGRAMALELQKQITIIMIRTISLLQFADIIPVSKNLQMFSL